MPHFTASEQQNSNQTWHEPAYYRDFGCTGAACEDTCCGGWGISVDKKTYDRYQTVSHPELGPKLQKLITIQTGSDGRTDARITLDDSKCPFLSEKLCSVHAVLGEEMLGQACSTFPRVVNAIDGVLERSLDLSCPEAARLALLNPGFDEFQEFSGTPGIIDGFLIEIAGNRDKLPAQTNAQQVHDIRAFALSILQNRKYSVAKRLVLLGHVCDKLSELEANGNLGSAGPVLEGFAHAIDAGLFDEHLHRYSANPASQLGIVLELVVARIALDYTPPRFRNLYADFSLGLELRADSTIPELAERYSDAYRLYFAPYVSKREHILEHYLVAYAYKNLFPFGSESVKRLQGLSEGPGTIASQYMLMCSFYAMTKSLLIGLAAHYRSAFNEMHIVSAVQSCSRALEHCTTYPARVLEVLAAKGIHTAAGMAILTQGLVEPAWAMERSGRRRMTASA